MCLFFLALYCLSFDLRLFDLALSVLRLPTFWPCIVCPSTYDFLALYCLSFNLRRFGLVLSVLRLTTTDYTFDIFKLFLHTRIHWCNYHTPWNYETIPCMYALSYFIYQVLSKFVATFSEPLVFKKWFSIFNSKRYGIAYLNVLFAYFGLWWK